MEGLGSNPWLLLVKMTTMFWTIVAIQLGILSHPLKTVELENDISGG